LAISDYLEEKTSAKVSVWLGACFGACDLPDSDADLVIQFGHSPWK
jgi:diphthamide biosynthesis enzyme Dph1/Dph2-like protein